MCLSDHQGLRFPAANGSNQGSLSSRWDQLLLVYGGETARHLALLLNINCTNISNIDTAYEVSKVEEAILRNMCMF